MTSPLSRRGFLAGAGAAGLALTAAGPAATASAASGRRPRGAATAIVNGRVFTATGRGPRRATAVAIGADGTILEVGDRADIRRWVTRSTEVIDARGGTVMPGLHDGHMHPLPAARLSLNPSLGNATVTVPQLQATIQGFLDATAADEPDTWLQVIDWNPVGVLPAGTVLDRTVLDALRTSRPIFLQGSDFHNSLVNSRGLAVAGVDRTTPDPPGGRFVRDAAGNPTGLLTDAAQFEVSGAIPPPTAAQLRVAYAAMADFLLANGVTSFLDAASGEQSLQDYTDLLTGGVLKQRVTPALVIDADLATTPAAALEQLRDLRTRYGGTPGLNLTTAKVFLDGVMEFPAQTAALLSPYLDADGRPTTHRGSLFVSDTDFRALTVALDRDGWQVHAHAIGDWAVQTALNGYQAAARDRRSARRPDPRHTIAHLELVDPADYARFRPAGALACMQLQWAIRNVFTLDALRPYLGEERWNRLYPAATLARHGATLTGGSDWPVDPFRPFTAIGAALDRSDVGGADPAPLNAGEVLTLRQVLTMHTAGSAFQLQDARSGTIEPGRRADLVVLDRDLGRTAPADIRGTQVRQTLIGGQVVFDAGTPTPAQRASQRAAQAAGARAMSELGRRRTPGQACCGHDEPGS